jgi:hypothetical protein
MLLSEVLGYQARNTLLVCAGLLLAVVAGATLSWFPYAWVLAALAGIGMTAAIFARPMFGLYLLCFAIPLSRFQSISVVNFVKVIGWVVGVAWLLHKAQTGWRFPKPRGLGWLAALGVVAAISMLWTVDKIAALIRLATIVQLLAFYLVVVDLVDSKEKIWRVLVVTSQGVIIASVAAVWLTMSRESVLLSLVADVSSNAFPGLSAYALGVALSLWLTGVSPVGQIGAMGLLVVSVIPVMLAGSRLGSLAMIAASFIAILLAPIVTGKKRYSLSFLLAIALLSVIAIPAIYESSWWERINLAYAYGSSRGGLLGARAFLWPAMFSRWMQRPLLGWGLTASHDVRGLVLAMQASSVADPLGFRWREEVAPHSALLWVAVEFGIIGLVLVVAIYWVHLRHLLEVIRLSMRRDELSTRICLALAIIAIIVFALSMGEDVFLRRFSWLSLALIEAAWTIWTTGSSAEAKGIP